MKQNINLTKDYFYTQYKKYLSIYYYNNEKSISNLINHYIKNQDELSVLILTNSAIDKANNHLNRYNENLYGEDIVREALIKLKPICFIDEPHLLKGEKFYQVFKEFKTLYFRFGATFPSQEEHKLSNLIYALDSKSAFNEYLVKQIRVHTLIQQNSMPSLIFADTRGKKATFSYFISNVEYKKTINYGEDLGEAFNNSSLKGISLIKVDKQKAYLSNHTCLEIKTNYRLSQEEISELLKNAIEIHFEKELKLFKQNIKALSLFFIPNISDFRGENPFIKNEFERLYKQKRVKILSQDLPQNYKEYLLKDFDSKGNLCVAQGYFSGDGKTQEEKETQGIKIILEEKQKLLSFKAPLRFIFSVWALQEGWDNPNIFTLTKLASSSSSTSRHQQVGRGLRLCVNQNGKRVTHGFLDYDDSAFFDINYLDVIVSSEEGMFIEGLQNEIEESSLSFNTKIFNKDSLKNILDEDEIDEFAFKLKELKVIEYDKENKVYNILFPIKDVLQSNHECKNILGNKFDEVLRFFGYKSISNKTNQLLNANKEDDSKIPIRKNLARDFKELWDCINQKATLSYENINSNQLIENISIRFNNSQIPKVESILQTKIYNPLKNKIEYIEKKITEVKEYSRVVDENVSLLLKDFAKDENMPLRFILGIYNSIDKNQIYKNPNLALKELKYIIKDEIHSSIIHQVSYSFTHSTFTQDPLYNAYGGGGSIIS